MFILYFRRVRKVAIIAWCIAPDQKKTFVQFYNTKLFCYFTLRLQLQSTPTTGTNNPNAALGFGATAGVSPNNLNTGGSAFALSPMLDKTGSIGNTGRESSATNTTLAAHQAMGQALVNQLLQSAPSKTTNASVNHGHGDLTQTGSMNATGSVNQFTDINTLMAQLSTTSSANNGNGANAQPQVQVGTLGSGGVNVRTQAMQ